jgi:hypothetical protein
MASLFQAITAAHAICSAIPLNGQARKWCRMKQLFKEIKECIQVKLQHSITAIKLKHVLKASLPTWLCTLLKSNDQHYKKRNVLKLLHKKGTMFSNSVRGSK